MRRAAVLLTLVALLAPATAAAQTDPFGPLPPPPRQPAPVPEPADDAGGGDFELGRVGLALVGLGVLGIFFLIGWLITRDARRSLTESDRAQLEREESGMTPEQVRRSRARAKQQARKKAKAQRAARRRNR